MSVAAHQTAERKGRKDNAKDAKFKGLHHLIIHPTYLLRLS